VVHAIEKKYNGGPHAGAGTVAIELSPLRDKVRVLLG
jgi:hypothetical protein